MSRWKRNGVVIVLYRYDHEPRHVHVLEDGKRPVKFDIAKWEVIEGMMTPRALRALETLREEGVWDEKS